MNSLYEWREFKARVSARNWESLPVRERKNLMDEPMPRRAVLVARCRLQELRARAGRPMTEDQRASFEYEKGAWFSWLKATMRDFRLSKEYLAANGLSWAECKRMAYE